MMMCPSLDNPRSGWMGSEHLMELLVSLFIAQSWTRWPLRVPFKSSNPDPMHCKTNRQHLLLFLHNAQIKQWKLNTEKTTSALQHVSETIFIQAE